MPLKKPLNNTKQYKRHDVKRRAWFKNRVGTVVIQLTTITKEVVIMSEQHATALYLTQIEKNYSYSDKEVNPKRNRNPIRLKQLKLL